MKKIAFLVGLICVTLSVAAQSIKGTSRIVLSHAGQPDKEVNFLLSESFSDAYDNTWDAEAANPGGIYVYSGGERYTTWASNAYSQNLPVGFASYNDENLAYTLKFENFTGTTTYKLYDRVAGTSIEVNGSTPDYNFTAESKNATFNNRFIINFSVDGLNVCFIDNKLTINANPYSSTIEVKDANGTPIAGSPFSAGTEEIDMTAIGNAGDRFTVEFDGGNKKFVIVKE